jgi:hypothetical protein
LPPWPSGDCRAVLRDEDLVRRRSFRGAADEGAHVLHVRPDILGIVLVDQRIVGLWHDVLAEEHGDPARLGEEIAAIGNDAATAAELGDLVGKRMMKSRIRSYSRSMPRLYSSIVAGLKVRSGNSSRNFTMPRCTRWMLVDSSGSMNPLASPSATQFLLHIFLRRPAVKRRKRGSASCAPSRLPMSVAAASSSLLNRLQYT